MLHAKMQNEEGDQVVRLQLNIITDADSKAFHRRPHIL